MTKPNTAMRSFGWRYDVQEGTGYPSSTAANGQWYRGVLYRSAAPAFRLPPEQMMLDRTASAAPPPRKRGRFRR